MNNKKNKLNSKISWLFKLEPNTYFIFYFSLQNRILHIYIYIYIYMEQKGIDAAIVEVAGFQD